MTYRKAAIFGVLLWLVLYFWIRPQASHDEWARILLSLAVLVWVPLAFELLQYPLRYAIWVASAGAALAITLFLPSGSMTGLLSCGWLLVSFLAFQRGLRRLRKWRRAPANVALGAAQIFLVIGALWAVFDRFGLQPLNFDPAIVLLTSVHFHYAGFIFPLLTGWLQQYAPNWHSHLAARLAVIAIPMTAIGITLMQVYDLYWPEAIAATVMAFSGWLCGFGYLRLAFRKSVAIAPRIAATGLAFSLFFSMTLALGYAMRGYYPIDFLQIPTMRAWHGSVNAIGVAGFGLWYKWLASKASLHKTSSACAKSSISQSTSSRPI